MEAVEESRGGTRLGSSSLVPEPGKYGAYDSKTLEDEAQAFLGDFVGNSLEGGARASLNEGRSLAGGEGFAPVNEGVVSGFEEDVEDPEINGASSLLKMREHSGIESLNWLCAHGDESKVLSQENFRGNSFSDNKDAEANRQDDEETNDEEHGFRVGDLVWGKIKSHPWWPGQIYDPSNASDLALKKQKGRLLLVAYFGDGTFAWCHHSQLKPFFDGFEEKSRVNNSRNLVNAVEEAVDEIGRNVEIGLTCSCVKKELVDGLIILPIVNSGIKEGTVVPVACKEVISKFAFEPKAILSQLENLACFAAVSDMLSYRILKRQLSAFYRAKGHVLPEYREPKTILGLEEDNSIKFAVKLRGCSNTLKEEHKRSRDIEQSRLVKCTGFPEDRQSCRRKQKSLSEILDAKGDSRDKVDEGASLQRKKKRKGDDESGKKGVAVLKSKGKMMGGVESGIIGESPEGTSESKEASKNLSEEAGESSLSELRGKVKIDIPTAGKDNGDFKEHWGIESLSRERKKSKYLSPPYTSDFTRKSKRSYFEAESTRSLNLSNGEASERKASEDIGEHVIEEVPGHETPSDGKLKDVTLSHVAEPVNKLLSGFRLLALKPQYANEFSLVGSVSEFILGHRKVYFLNISGDKMYNKLQHDNKRKRESLESQLISNDHDQDAKLQLKEVSGNDQDSSAELLVTFSPGSVLPKEDDLASIYGKYYSFHRGKTNMFPQQLCARIFFTNVSDAEEAFNTSQKTSPFGKAGVIFRLRHLSPGQDLYSPPAKKRGRPKVSKPGVDESLQIDMIKNKFDSLRSMLESCNGRISAELKSKLEVEMKEMLQKLRSLVVSS